MIFTFVALATSVADAAVVSRSASRASGARAPTMAIKVNNSPQPTQTTQTTQPVQSTSVNTPVYENSQPLVIYTVPATTVNTTPEPIDFGPIENKTSQFDTILNNASTVNADAAATSLAEMVRAQRAALDATSLATTKTNSTAQINACDTGLRSCMTDKCGKNFAKCSSDNDTLFGTKLDACRRNLTCNANEFKLFSAEIKADRALAIKLKSFNDILDCGNEYDQCILTQCGTTYAKCLGKRDGDTAISKCSSIANRCREMDSGLPNRAMSVFATLRQTAEKQIVSDEQRLYTMRDDMRSMCRRIGAMFDDRSLDCVYTVNFYAGDDHTLYASKKLYAGSTFDCTPNWFGIDVTTFMDNAYRRTRAVTSASSAMLGSGVGMAVGSLTSGAIDRAIDTKKADNALERAKCEQDGKGKWNAILGQCVTDKQTEKAKEQQKRQQERITNRATGNTAINKVGNAVKNVTTKAANGVKDVAGAVGTAITGMFQSDNNNTNDLNNNPGQSGGEGGGGISAAASGTETPTPAIDEPGGGEGGATPVVGGGEDGERPVNNDIKIAVVDKPICDAIKSNFPTTQEQYTQAALAIFGNKYCTQENGPQQTNCDHKNGPTIMCRFNYTKHDYKDKDRQPDITSICNGNIDSYIYDNCDRYWNEDKSAIGPTKTTETE
ncbi:MAG: hypothetical protein J6S74_02100 [Alphaproteobacteria bacterium]|nr:hypothetical protein [Alphaproteobacteria bacterium]